MSSSMSAEEATTAMLSTPLSRMNISCTCGECTTFLRPYPKPSFGPPTLLLNPSFGFSLPVASDLTPDPTPKPTPRLRATAQTLKPSPLFGFTRSSSLKRPSSYLPAPCLPPSFGSSIPAASDLTPALTWGSTPRLRRTTPTLAPSPLFGTTHSSSLKTDSDPLPRSNEAACRATLISRTLFTHLSSPLGDSFPPLSAKTPGVAFCGSEGCKKRVVPGFGRSVCAEREEDIRGAVVGLASRLEGGCVRSVKDEQIKKADSEEKERTEELGDEYGKDEEVHFALPSTPPSTKLLLRHSRHSSTGSASTAMSISTCSSSYTPPSRPTERGSRAVSLASPPLFALPNTSLDTAAYEEVTPTSRHAMEFPALPGCLRTTAPGKAGSTSERSSGELARDGRGCEVDQD